MEKKVKYILISAIGATCFTALIIFNYAIVSELDISSDSSFNDGISGNPDRLKSVHNITVRVDFAGVKSNGEVANFSLYNYKTSAFYATEKAFDIEYNGGPESEAFIYKIDGVENNINKANHYWIYYVNGKYAGIGTSDFNLVDGDEIEWKYEDRSG